MHSRFNEYYRPSKAEFDLLWKNAIISVDANVLLSVYRFSESVRNQLIELLERFKKEGRLWLSHQAGLEFHRNRYSVILAQVKNIRSLSNNLQETVKDLQKPRAHPNLSEQAYLSYKAAVEIVIEEMERKASEFLSLFDKDYLLEVISQLFEGAVGDQLDKAQLAELRKEAPVRFEQKMPPGYQDAKKNEKSLHLGDLILWKQLLKKAREDKCAILFVTDDVKEDWYLRIDGRTLGPRPELLEEFQKYTNHPFYMYNSEQFLEYGYKKNNLTIDLASLEEVRRMADELRQEIEAKKEEYLNRSREDFAIPKHLFFDADGQLVSDQPADALKLLKHAFLKAYLELKENEDQPE